MKTIKSRTIGILLIKRLCFVLCISAIFFSELPVSADTVSSDVQITAQEGHTQPVKKVMYSHKGDFIVSFAGDNKIKIWTSDGRLIRTIQTPGLLSSIALSPDDQLIASANVYGWVFTWSSRTGKLVQKFPKMTAALTGEMAFAPDMSYLLVCSKSSKNDYCQMFSLDGQAGTRFDDPSGKHGSPKDIAISPDSEFIYLAAHKSVYKMDRSGNLVKEIPVTQDYVERVALSPDGKMFATSVAYESVSMEKRMAKEPVMTRLWNSDGQKITEFLSHSTRSLSFSKDGQWIVSGGVHDNRVLIYDIESQQTKALKIGQNSRQSPTYTALSPDKKQFVAVSREFKPVRMNIWGTDGTLVSRKKTATAGVIALDIDTDTNVIVTTSADNQVRYWSLDGRLLQHHPAEYDYPHLLAITPNGRAVVTGGTALNLWNTQGEKLATIPIHKIDGRALEFSSDSKYLITGGADGFVNIIPMEKGTKAIRFKAHEGKAISSIAIHPDSHIFASGTTRNEFKIWNMQGKMISAYALLPGSDPPYSSVYDMAFTPDGQQLITASTRQDQEIKFFDINGKFIKAMSVPNRDESGCIAFSSTGKWLAVSMNHRIGVWDYSRKRFYSVLKGHKGGIRAMKFTADEQHLVSASSDGSVRVWNVENGASFSMLSQKDQWVIYTDDGYFDASRYGGDMVSIVNGLNAYGVDQYALYYNRPDIIYSRLGIGSPGFVHHFKTCYEKRLSEFRLTDNLSDKHVDAPKITILNHSQKDKFMVIDFEVKDETHQVDCVQVYVNDVPLYPGRGKIVGSDQKLLTEKIELSSGENKIELSATNNKGVESLRSAVYAEYNKKIKGDLYFIGLGVSEYHDVSINLNYAHKDVTDLGEFVEKYKGHFEKIHKLQIINEKATRSSLKDIHSFLSQAKVDDTVMLLITGHGGHDLSDTGTYYFFPHEVQAGKLDQTAIAFSEFEKILGAIAPRKKILFLDTCESGEIDPDMLKQIQTSAEEKGLLVRSRYSLVRKEKIPQRPYLLYRNRYIYNDLSRKTGTIIFSSSLATELSIESPVIENGIFTEALMLQLMDPETDVNKDGYISITELETSVKVWVALATNNLQHPNIERENIYLDFKLPVVQ